jgi:hypothetical protein
VTRRRALAAAALVALLAGCAPLVPPSPPRLTLPSVEARFTSRLAERRSRVGVAEGEYAVWVQRAGAKKLPGATMRVRLVAPDAFRLRVDAALGVAVDASARRDTLVLDAPALGIAAVTDAGQDRSSRQDIGSWVWRALSASWAPPGSAWAAGAEQDSAWAVRWIEAKDSLELAVAATGLPRSLSIRPPKGEPIGIRYERWSTRDGVMWPDRLVVADGSGRVRVTLQPQSLTLRAHDSQGPPRLKAPSGALRLTREELVEWLEKLVLSGGDSLREGGE